MAPFVAVAGGAGGLGKLIVKALVHRGVTVKALVRPNTDPIRTADLAKVGVTVVSIDLANVPGLTVELTGATCVVSALQGLQDVILGSQKTLLDAAVAAHVPRFIPSDFSLDFTKTTPGSNRNLDFRRAFHADLRKSGIAWTSILNGGFMDLLGGDSPMINHKSHKVPYCGQPTQKLDFTTMADTAAFTAAVAADPNPTPNFLRIAGVVTSTQDIAAVQTAVQGVPYRPSWMGPVGVVSFLGRVMRLFRIGGGENDLLPPWQGIQYMVNMMSGAGKLEPLDNDRYPDVKWTTLEEFFRKSAKK